MPVEDPWDHNGECRYCDELGMHRADCSWLVALVADVAHLETDVELLAARVADRDAKRQQIAALLDDIRQQYQRRQGMFASAGGDPEQMQGSLTCYLDYALLRQVFATAKAAKKP